MIRKGITAHFLVFEKLIFIVCAAIAMLPCSVNADPLAIPYGFSVTGVPVPRFIATSGGKTFIAGFSSQAVPNTVVSCINSSTGQKCNANFPVTITVGSTAQKGASGIAVDKSGKIWVTSAFSDSVARIDSTGSYTVFNTGGDTPEGVTVGADGDIWIGNLDSNTISRLDPSSGANHASYPIASGAPIVNGFSIGPTQLVTALDGSIWAVIFDGRSGMPGGVTRIDPLQDEVTSGFPKSTGGVGPVSLTVGHDGDIWVSNGDDSSLSRLDPATGINRAGFPKFVGGENTAESMATGNDGNIWYTLDINDEIHRFDADTNAEVSGFPITTLASQIKGIWIDPTTGDPWVAVIQINNSRVVHLSLSGHPPATPTPSVTPNKAFLTALGALKSKLNKLTSKPTKQSVADVKSALKDLKTLKSSLGSKLVLKKGKKLSQLSSSFSSMSTAISKELNKPSSTNKAAALKALKAVQGYL